MKNEKLYATVLLALFTAIIFIMAFTPLGYIPVLVIGVASCVVSIVVGLLALNGAKKLG